MRRCSGAIVSRGVIALWQIAVGATLAYGSWRLVSGRLRQPAPPLTFAPRHEFGAVTVADVAFDYERAVLELDDVSEETKERAIWAASRVVAPLVGRLRLAEVTPELETGVGTVIRARLDPDQEWVVHVWADLLRWGRQQQQAASSQRAGQYRLGL